MISMTHGKRYRLTVNDGRSPKTEIVFMFLNVFPNGKLELEVDGHTRVVGGLDELCHPWTYDVQPV